MCSSCIGFISLITLVIISSRSSVEHVASPRFFKMPSTILSDLWWISLVLASLAKNLCMEWRKVLMQCSSGFVRVACYSHKRADHRFTRIWEQNDSQLELLVGHYTVMMLLYVFSISSCGVQWSQTNGNINVSSSIGDRIIGWTSSIDLSLSLFFKF